MSRFCRVSSCNLKGYTNEPDCFPITMTFCKQHWETILPCICAYEQSKAGTMVFLDVDENIQSQYEDWTPESKVTADEKIRDIIQTLVHGQKFWMHIANLATSREGINDSLKLVDCFRDTIAEYKEKHRIIKENISPSIEAITFMIEHRYRLKKRAGADPTLGEEYKRLDSQIKAAFASVRNSQHPKIVVVESGQQSVEEKLSSSLSALVIKDF